MIPCMSLIVKYRVLTSSQRLHNSVTVHARVLSNTIHTFHSLLRKLLSADTPLFYITKKVPLFFFFS